MSSKVNVNNIINDPEVKKVLIKLVKQKIKDKKLRDELINIINSLENQVIKKKWYQYVIDIFVTYVLPLFISNKLFKRK